MKTQFTLLFLLFFVVSNAQIWEDNLLSTNPNASIIEKAKAFENYKDKVEYTKGNGYKPYARNLDFILQRTSNEKGIPNGKLYTEWLKEKERLKQYKSSSNSNWTELGPINTPIILSNGKKRGNGRINCIAFDPFDKEKIWIGSPGGGLWSSSDGGNTWSTNTDGLPVIGVSYIAINPLNSQEMYITTGDAHASDTYSIGILKSNDGGQTWDTTGMQFGITDDKMVNKVIIHPTYTDSLFAVTDKNIKISADGGQTWSNALTSSGSTMIGRFRDIEFKPNNPNILYAVKQTTGSSEVYKSTDRGLSWSSAMNGISLVNRNRPLLAVTPANPDVVYVLFCKNDYGFHGIYKSMDNADSWTLQSDSPNILGRSTDGTSTGGQSWYDLSLGVSTEDEDLLYVGGINLWRSTDGGINWNISGSSGNGSNYSYMHVDQHALEFNPLNGVAYAGNDGGLYEYMDTLNSWIDISDGLAISQFYKIGLSNTLNGRVVAGAQDNGTEMITNGVWDAIRGSDGMECAIDIYDHEIIYSTSQYGGLRKSYNGGGNWNNIKPVSYSGAWVTPWKIHPVNNNIIVAGYDEVYRSQTGGGQWDSLSYNASNGASIQTIALAASNEDYIYSASYSKIKRTKDAGASWTDIKQGLANFNFSDITVDYYNEDRLWVTYSEYHANHKVYESLDGGDSWTNITGTGLPNLPINCIVHQKQANDDLYVGTDVGVYHKDNITNTWVPFMNGLPNVIVNELEINYNTQKIVAATFGRGVWESDLNVNSTGNTNYNSKGIVIYPNPANEQISITGAPTQSSIINIYGLDGKKIITKTYSSNLIVSFLSKGCYFLEIMADNYPPIVKKLIIK